MKYCRQSGGQLEFSARAMEILQGARQATDSAPESGGMLLGRMITDSDHVVVDTATLPSLGDKQGRYFYQRARDSAQHIINTNWKKSHQTVNYLGEWHTHPEPIPHPSDTDVNNWKRITRKARYEQEHLFFVIVGIKEVKVWESDKRTGLLAELKALGADYS